MEEVDWRGKEVRERLMVVWWREKGRGKKREESGMEEEKENRKMCLFLISWFR